MVTTRSGYQAYPHRSRSEGFYLSVLQKTDPGPTVSKIPTLRYFTKASRATIQTVAHWLPTQQDWEVVSDPQEQLYLLHPRHLSVLARLSSAFSKIVPGISMGSLKGKQLVPGHALALAAHGTEALPGIEVDQETALAFLRKLELRDYLAGSPDGWQAVRYDGYSLGWVKVLPRRVNNYLPKNYRIRMEGA
jgi:NOL1/NOP2/fmu family ribosome biogenesis protein